MEKVVIITGGTSGIGLEVSRKFLSVGAKVVIASVDCEATIEKSMNELSELGEVSFYKCNVACHHDCQDVVTETIKKYGRIDILVNVAGITGKREKLIEGDLANIRQTIEVNLMGSINMAHYVAKEMVTQKSGTIVNVGSICGFMVNSESIGYHASKGGVKMFTQALARELAPFGIRVVSVAPGWVRTAMVDEKTAELGGTFHLKNRILEPKEISDAIYLLTLDEASGINGTTVMVDDGYTTFKGTWD